MNPQNPQVGLGAKPRPKDKRDYKPEALGTVSVIPDTIVSPTKYIYMQGIYGTCGAHGGASMANDLFGIISSPKFLWKNIKQIDGFGLNDGTDMRSIMQSLQSVGVCELSLLDDSMEASIEAYSDINEVTQAMKDNASKYKISNYGFIDNPTWDQIRQSIATYKAVILLVDCGDGWWLPSWGAQNNPLHVGNFVGHHFICADAYGLTIIDGPNSWSTAWGDQGFFNFDATYLPHVLELGFATIGGKYIFNNNLSFGMINSADVHALQVRLGMPPEYQTGNFFAKTLSAVLQYQRSNGINATGFVGPITRASLNK